MLLTAAMLTNGAAGVNAQDLVAVSDITGGSSVFVFRGASRSAPKRYVSGNKPRRSKKQRIETAKKINRQYVRLAKVAPRRTRTQAVDPLNLPAQVRTMPKADAARLFAGVGEYYIDRDDSANAIRFFSEANSLDPTYKIAQTGLSEALAQSGNELLVKDDFRNAKLKFEEALKFNMNNAVAYYGLAEVFAESDADADSIVNYERALQFDKDLTEIYVPLGILYYQAGQIAKSDELLTKALAVSDDSAELNYFVGLIRYSQNRTEDALKAFQRAKQLDPAYAEAYYYTGETLVRMNRGKEAIPEYQKAIDLKTNYYDAWSRLGSVYFDQENYPEAIKAYRQAVRLKNDNIEAHLNLGDAYRLSGLPNSFNDAEASYKLATTFIERDPNFSKAEAADVYNKAGFVIAKQCEINMRRAVPCRWEAGIAYLEKAVALNAGTVEYANLGWAYYNAGRSDRYDKREASAVAKLTKARDHLQRAVDENPQFMEGPLLNLGMTYSDLGDYKGAIKALEKVVKKEPNWPFALNELGIAHRRNNDLKEAAKYFRRALDQDKDYAPAHFNLGEAEVRSGNMAEAKKEHQTLLRLGRKDLAGQLVLISGGAVAR